MMKFEVTLKVIRQAKSLDDLKKNLDDSGTKVVSITEILTYQERLIQGLRLLTNNSRHTTILDNDKDLEILCTRFQPSVPPDKLFTELEQLGWIKEEDPQTWKFPRENKDETD
jgi:hypothetical protein